MLRSVRAYWGASAAALALLAAAGFFAVARTQPVVLSREFLVFDTPHNALHVLLALLALGMLAAPARVSLRAARAVGIVYLALAALGFVSGRLFGLSDLTGFHLELAENVAHLGLGAWGTLVGTQRRLPIL